jgi:hypothetical protein
MRESPHPRVELEIAIVRATRRPVPEAIEEVLRRIDEAQARLGPAGAGTGPAAPVQASLLAPSPGPARSGPEPRRAPAAVSPAPAPAAVPPPPPPVAGSTDEALTTAWQRAVEEVMRKKPMLATVLSQARPLGVTGGELAVTLTGNHFHRELLADRANRELIIAAVRRWLPDVERLGVTEAAGAGGEITTHPAVQAAIAEFEGEVVAVRPRPPEGEGQ